MPLFYQKQINEHTQMAVWEIMEPEEFFLQKVTIQKEITNLNKRLQHLAGRYLLQFLAPDFPLHSVSISTSRKPLLVDNSYHFSISHCGKFAAAIVSTKFLVGIDVELIRWNIEKIANRFLDVNELNLIKENYLPDQYTKWMTLFWSCKEAMFKWHGDGGVDFRKNMTIGHFTQLNNGGLLHTKFQKETIVSLNPEFLFFGDLCLVWIV